MYSVAIVSYNTCSMTLDCIESVRSAMGGEPHEIIVVDNASTDGTCQAIRDAYPKVKLFENESNSGYARAVNQAVRECSSRIVLVANADTLFDDSILHGFEYMEHHANTAAMGCQQRYPDGRRQRSHGREPSIRLALSELLYIEKIRTRLESLSRSNLPKEVEYADGAVLWFRKEIFDELGGFDEEYFFYTEEADYCHRARANGYSVVTNPEVSVIHYRGAASSGQSFNRATVDMLVSSKRLFLRKHCRPAESRAIKACYIAHHLANAALYSLAGAIAGSSAREQARIQFRFYKAWKKDE